MQNPDIIDHVIKKAVDTVKEIVSQHRTNPIIVEKYNPAWGPPLKNMPAFNHFARLCKYAVFQQQP